MPRLMLGVAFLAAFALHLTTGASAAPASTALSPQASLFFGKAAIHSHNWAGYMSTGGAFHSITSSWTQPSVTCTPDQPEAFASFWAGLGGFGTPSIEQIGTGIGCYEGTLMSYSWYQMLPNPPVTLARDAYPVAPGDVLHASVTTNAGGRVTMTLTDARGWSFTTQQKADAAQMASAECIAEAPEVPSDGSLVALVDFGTVRFGECIADGKPLAATAHPAMVTMAAQDITKAAPSWSNPRNSGFAVTWLHP